MDATKLKEIFLAKLPQDRIHEIPKIYMDIIDEGIEQAISGQTNFNGKMPETENEWYVAIGMHFVTATAALDGLLKGTRKAFSKEPINVTINYRGDTHQFYYEALESEA